MCSESANSAKPLHCRGEALWRPLASNNISYQAVSRYNTGSAKVIVDPHPDSDQHQTFIHFCHPCPCFVDI